MCSYIVKRLAVNLVVLEVSTLLEPVIAQIPIVYCGVQNSRLRAIKYWSYVNQFILSSHIFMTLLNFDQKLTGKQLSLLRVALWKL